MLSYGAWQRRFGGDESVLGEVLRLDAVPHTVVGVLPPEAVFPEEREIWTLLQKSPDERSGWSLRCLGRLREAAVILALPCPVAQVFFEQVTNFSVTLIVQGAARPEQEHTDCQCRQRVP